MKKVILVLSVLFLIVNISHAQEDSLQTHRFVTRATMYGIGYTNILDTYLSPVEYAGTEFRFSRETMRMTKLFNGNVSLQNLLQANISYSENKPKTGSVFAGLVNWSCGLHYQFQINKNLKILAGGLGELNGGFIYNLRNSNNPANAKAYINLAASGMLIYHFKIKKYPMIIRYQANLPLIGAMFSPDYQQSYYEIFTLKNRENIIKFTSLHNQPSLRQMLTLDFPVRYVRLRAGYICDIQQSYVNGLKTHAYSHIFMLGFVKNLYRIKKKNNDPLPDYIKRVY